MKISNILIIILLIASYKINNSILAQYSINEFINYLKAEYLWDLIQQILLSFNDNEVAIFSCYEYTNSTNIYCDEVVNKYMRSSRETRGVGPGPGPAPSPVIDILEKLNEITSNFDKINKKFNKLDIKNINENIFKKYQLMLENK